MMGLITLICYLKSITISVLWHNIIGTHQYAPHAHLDNVFSVMFEAKVANETTLSPSETEWSSRYSLQQ